MSSTPAVTTQWKMINYWSVWIWLSSLMPNQTCKSFKCKTVSLWWCKIDKNDQKLQGIFFLCTPWNMHTDNICTREYSRNITGELEACQEEGPWIWQDISYLAKTAHGQIGSSSWSQDNSQLSEISSVLLNFTRWETFAHSSLWTTKLKFTLCKCSAVCQYSGKVAALCD